MNNYHRHSHYSNIMSPDSAVRNEDYAKRAKELGAKILSSCEHGFQGNYFETYELAKQYDLKFIYGAEAYWVKDRFSQDKTNSHLCLFARTNKGRKAINLALADANINGYYYKPRLDLELLLNLPPNDVFLTSACIAFWKYEDIEDIILKLHNHFQDNFMLEIQYHNTDLQKKINEKILNLSKLYNIKMIVGMDSHFIHDNQSIDRDEVLLSKGVRYEDEDGWFMDYPDEETVISRFKNQGVLPEDIVADAILNTKVFELFDDFDGLDIFSSRIKLPSLHKNLSQSEKDRLLLEILNKSWNEYKKNIPKEERKRHIDEIKKEYNIIVDTKMADYFLYDYEVVKRAVEKGGMITPSGRGSGVSNFSNTLLGFSKIDRINADVAMFPERFMSTSRILESGSLPDLDLNLGNPEVFAEAQREISGEHNSYPMIAFGTFKKKSAWKMYAKAKNVDFDIANEVSKQIEAYENELKHTPEDEKDTVDIEDFIDEKYINIFKDSEIYQGIISDKKAHPCAWLIYDYDIREEIGIIKVKSETTNKETLVCLLDGLSAEKFKFLKNDLLKVDSVLLFYKIAEKIKEHIPYEYELIQKCEGNKKVWDIYSSGCTLGINQCEKYSTTKKAMKYKPQNIKELSAFIAGIRPSFKSMYHIFEAREYFEYGIPTFDKIIQSTGVDSSFILYQETIMAVLAFAGFPQDETYDIIKAISKKRIKKIMQIRPRFIENFKKEIINNDGLSEEEAVEASEKIWTIIENSSQYGFNASHSYSMAYDSLLCAYYKSHHTLTFYETLLQEYTLKGNKDKVSALKAEALKYFNIESEPFRFRQDNRSFVANASKNTIQQDLQSIKGFGKKIGKYLYSIGDKNYDNFIELLNDLPPSEVTAPQLDTLIKLDYFEEFGTSKVLCKIVEVYNKYYSCKVISKKNLNPKLETIVQKYARATDAQYRDIDNGGLMSELISLIPNKDFSLVEKIKFQFEFLGYADYKNPNINPDYHLVTDIEIKYKNPTITVYNINSGETSRLKCKIKEFEKNEFSQWDVINITKIKDEGKWSLLDGEWIQDNKNKEPILKEWKVVK